MSLFLENLSIGRGGVALAAPIDLRLEAGQVLVLTGPNGSGKTTLLRTIAGLLPPLAGWVAHIGGAHWIGPENGLKGDLSVRENLEFFSGGLPVSSVIPAKAGIHVDAGASGKMDPGLRRNDDIIKALAKLNIAALADIPVRRLSAGQKRRAALARLFLDMRPLWLLDEPATGLDDAASAQLIALVREHAAGGGIAVIATHEPAAWHADQSLDLASKSPLPREREKNGRGAA